MSRRSIVAVVGLLGIVVLAVILALNWQPFAMIRKTGLPISPSLRDTTYYGTEGEPRTVILIRVSDAEIARLDTACRWRTAKTDVWYDEIPWYRDLVHYTDFASIIPPHYKDAGPQHSVQAADGSFKGASWTAILERDWHLLWIAVEWDYDRKA